MFALAFDPTITFGNVVQIAALVVTAFAAYTATTNAIEKRLTSFEGVVRNHAQTLVDHSDRMERHDQKISEVAERLSFLMGQSEARPRRPRT